MTSRQAILGTLTLITVAALVYLAGKRLGIG